MTHEINDQDSVSRLTIKAWTRMHWSKQGFDKVWQEYLCTKKKSEHKIILIWGKKQQNTLIVEGANKSHSLEEKCD